VYRAKTLLNLGGIFMTIGQTGNLPIRTAVTAKSRFELNRHKALELFAHKGFSQVSMRELAGSLQMSAGALYNHHTNKTELLQEFIEEFYMLILGILPKKQQTSPNTLRKTVKKLIALHASNSLHFKLATNELRYLNPAQRLETEELRQQIKIRLGRLVASQLEIPATLEGASEIMLNIFENLPNWLASSQLNDEERCNIIMDFLLSAFMRIDATA
jgi:AcrR family transcriptional regulator